VKERQVVDDSKSWGFKQLKCLISVREGKRLRVHFDYVDFEVCNQLLSIQVRYKSRGQKKVLR
jgi:hypothetical protein